MSSESAFDELQLNGTCWDCGQEHAMPVYRVTEFRIDTPGWQCGCGRWWPVFCEDDLCAWVMALGWQYYKKATEDATGGIFVINRL